MHSIFHLREWNVNSYRGFLNFIIFVMSVLILLNTFSFTAEISWSCTLLSAAPRNRVMFLFII